MQRRARAEVDFGTERLFKEKFEFVSSMKPNFFVGSRSMKTSTSEPAAASLRAVEPNR